jgi:ketosteroid isomerase-like protein
MGQEAFNAGDLSPLKPYLAPDVEWGAAGAFPGLARSYRGLEGMDEWMATVRSSFSSFSATTERVISDEEDRIVLVEHLRAVGRESGAEVEMRIYAVYDIADGRITRRRAFATEEEALAAAG